MAAQTEQWTVLVVDDDPDHARFCIDALARAGLRVVASRGGRDALDRIREHRPEMVLLDLPMAEASGWDVVRALRASEATRRLPVIVLSGREVYEPAPGARLWDVQGYLTKPCDPYDLTAVVLGTILEQRRTRPWVG